MGVARRRARVSIQPGTAALATSGGQTAHYSDRGMCSTVRAEMLLMVNKIGILRKHGS